MDKRTKYTPENVRTPMLPTNPLVQEFNDGIPKGVLGADVENPEPPRSSFDPLIQRNVKEIQFGAQDSNSLKILEKGGIFTPIIFLSAEDRQVLITDQCIFADTTAGSIELTMPKGVSGKTIEIVKVSASNTLTITPYSGDTFLDTAGGTVYSAISSGGTFRFFRNSAEHNWFKIP